MWTTVFFPHSHAPLWPPATPQDAEHQQPITAYNQRQAIKAKAISLAHPAGHEQRLQRQGWGQISPSRQLQTAKRPSQIMPIFRPFFAMLKKSWKKVEKKCCNPPQRCYNGIVVDGNRHHETNERKVKPAPCPQGTRPCKPQSPAWVTPTAGRWKKREPWKPNKPPLGHRHNGAKGQSRTLPFSTAWRTLWLWSASGRKQAKSFSFSFRVSMG